MWQYDEIADTWETACGEAWSFVDGNPRENNCRFCPFCGKKIKEESPDAE